MKTNIERATVRNNAYRRVLYTVKNSIQLVVMSLKPKQEIGMEVHNDTSQFIRVEEGKGIAYISGRKYMLKAGDAVIIPKGSKHNIINTHKSKSLKLYSLYTPPVHKDKLVERQKHE
jgi:mannose-6-phosphate isomerase-like protein (cupin superfamily)